MSCEWRAVSVGVAGLPLLHQACAQAGVLFTCVPQKAVSVTACPVCACSVVPVSGGGMLSGIALAAKALKPSITIIAAEPSGSNDAADVAACKEQGRLIQDMPKPATIADGLQGRLLL